MSLSLFCNFLALNYYVDVCVIYFYFYADQTVVLSLEQSETITPLTLTCNTTGSPPTDVTWSKDGVQIDIASNRSKYAQAQVLVNRITARYRNTLVINDVGDDLIGRYSCSRGPNSNSVELKGTYACTYG